MNTQRDAINGLAAFFRSDQNVLLMNGTHQHEKHPLAIAAAVQYTPTGSSILFRVNHRGNADGFLRGVGINRVPAAGRTLNVNGHPFYLDTINTQSWHKTPFRIDTAIVYPLDSLNADAGSECVQDLIRRRASKICLVTWTDNKDFTWVDAFNPVLVTYDAEAERPDYHEHMKEIEAEGSTRRVPRNLPSYAQSGDPSRLIKINCRTCRSSRWAELNKPYPGIATLRNSCGEGYEAKCLSCGTVATDHYNWYGQS